MKKLILLSVLSVLLYSAPGYAGEEEVVALTPEERVAAEAVREKELAELAELPKEEAEKKVVADRELAAWEARLLADAKKELLVLEAVTEKANLAEANLAEAILKANLEESMRRADEEEVEIAEAVAELEALKARKVVRDKELAEKELAEKELAERAVIVAAEKEGAELFAREKKEAAQQAAAEKAAEERAAEERAVIEAVIEAELAESAAIREIILAAWVDESKAGAEKEGRNASIIAAIEKELAERAATFGVRKAAVRAAAQKSSRAHGVADDEGEDQAD